jgi:hypothetical protein
MAKRMTEKRAVFNQLSSTDGLSGITLITYEHFKQIMQGYTLDHDRNTYSLRTLEAYAGYMISGHIDSRITLPEWLISIYHGHSAFERAAIAGAWAARICDIYLRNGHTFKVKN